MGYSLDCWLVGITELLTRAPPPGLPEPARCVEFPVRSILHDLSKIELVDIKHVSAKDITIPDGLYVTTRPLSGHEEHVPAGTLVMFHQQSEQGYPIVTLPRDNHNNRWRFFERGYLVKDTEYLKTLSPRRAEGFYILNRAVHLNTETIIPKRTLVQLSYSRKGTPIVYIGTFEGNTISFPTAGYKFSEQVLGFLTDAGFRAPTPQSERRLH